MHSCLSCGLEVCYSCANQETQIDSAGQRQEDASPGEPESSRRDDTVGIHLTDQQQLREGWRFITSIDLEAELRKPVRTIREVPRWFREKLRQAFLMSLKHRESHADAGWKLFILTPRMLLKPTVERGEAGKKVFLDRMRRFVRGE